jgi:hypothetical protein
VNRYLFLLHRYLGIGLGLLISIWCLSGIVMMYVEYPELTDEDQVAALATLDLADCCELPTELDATASSPIEAMRIEMLATRPVLQIEYASRERKTIDLTNGSVVGTLDAISAERVAADFARARGLDGYGYAGQLERDQWTVYGAYDPLRPLHKYIATDEAGTQWYISRRTGEVVQVTTASERFWNWLGAVPHWLYPTVLRQHTALWSQVVIWLTVVATFLTILGVYVGLRQFKSRRNGRYSPYRGTALWHHYVGLGFGALMLTWLISGFFSMNPWGALEGRNFAAEIERQHGGALILDDRLANQIERLAGLPLPLGTVRLEAQMVDAQHFFIAWKRNGARSVLDEGFHEVVPFSQSAILGAAARMRPGYSVAMQGWIDEDDAYYFSHHEQRPLPVYRIVYSDGERFYLDALSGEIVYAADRGRQWYRWLHYGLHRGDFSAFIRERPVWDAFLLPLLLGVSLSGLTGTWIGLRRILRWIESRKRRTLAHRSQLDLTSAG